MQVVRSSHFTNVYHDFNDDNHDIRPQTNSWNERTCGLQKISRRLSQCRIPPPPEFVAKWYSADSGTDLLSSQKYWLRKVRSLIKSMIFWLRVLSRLCLSFLAHQYVPTPWITDSTAIHQNNSFSGWSKQMWWAATRRRECNKSSSKAYQQGVPIAFFTTFRCIMQKVRWHVSRSMTRHTILCSRSASDASRATNAPYDRGESEARRARAGSFTEDPAPLSTFHGDHDGVTHWNTELQKPTGGSTTTLQTRMPVTGSRVMGSNCRTKWQPSVHGRVLK
jgi:hypothetical protein